jgi:hypothetical protein
MYTLEKRKKERKKFRFSANCYAIVIKPYLLALTSSSSFFYFIFFFKRYIYIFSSLFIFPNDKQTLHKFKDILSRAGSKAFENLLANVFMPEGILARMLSLPLTPSACSARSGRRLLSNARFLFSLKYFYFNRD